MERNVRGSRQRLYMPAPCDEDKVGQSLAWLVEHCATINLRGVILVPTVRQIEGTLFSKVLGERLAGSVKKNKKLRVPVGQRTVELAVLSQGQLRRESHFDAALLLWPGKKLFEEFDRMSPSADCLAVAWTEHDNERWEAELGLSPLGAAPTARQEMPVLRAALKSLTRRVNLSTGLAHPSDKEAFVDLLYLLRDAGEPLDPSYCSRTLIGLGWDVEDANGAADLMRRFIGGTRLRRPRRSVWREGIVEQWRQHAGNERGE